MGLGLSFAEDGFFLVVWSVNEAVELDDLGVDVDLKGSRRGQFGQHVQSDAHFGSARIHRLTGCGDEIPGDFHRGVLSGDTPLGGLSDGDLDKLCNELETFSTTGSYGMNLQEMSCLLTGMITAAFTGPETDAELQAGCKAAYDQCKAQPFEPETSECTKPQGTCTATVAELRQCMQDSAKALDTVVADLPSCSEITLDSESDPGTGETTNPPSCVALEQKCPGFQAQSMASL